MNLLLFLEFRQIAILPVHFSNKLKALAKKVIFNIYIFPDILKIKPDLKSFFGGTGGVK